ncbi:MAG: iron-containing redox enzyme family protein [Actinomycetes bacterium]
MKACSPRGPLSHRLVSTLGSEPFRVEGLRDLAEDVVAASRFIVDDEDVQLSLYLLYELHYGGLEGVDDRWEWSPQLLEARAVLEARFEQDLRAEFSWADPEPALEDLPSVLFQLAAPSSSPSGGGVASYVAREATLEQVAELLALRSVYQLKEGDPQTWTIPRLSGPAKAALVEIQMDEYGGGRFERMHSQLFARCLRSVGMSEEPNRYLEHVPAVTLASVNAMSLFGLHRRLRGASCGLLAAFEMTSSLPCRRYVSGLQRLGLGENATEFFDEHVEADAVHEQVAAHDLCGGLARQEPGLVDDVLLGAAVCLGLDARSGDRVLAAWSRGRSALRKPLELDASSPRANAGLGRPHAVA